MHKRRPLLVANWKMHKTRREAGEFFAAYTMGVKTLTEVVSHVDLAFGVPATLFDVCLNQVRGTGVNILAQNVHWERQGAFTGEISVGMLEDCQVAGSIIGHSERRQYFAETNKSVGQKWNALALSGLRPIVCVGETKTEREAGKTLEVVRTQLSDALSQVTNEAKEKEFAIAYEPVWAIGTGLTASPQQAEEVQEVIRAELWKILGPKCAEMTRILYGGSMNASNIKELLSEPNIDGGLVGGASLKADEFAKMTQIAAAQNTL